MRDYYYADGLDAQGNPLEVGADYSVYDHDEQPTTGLICRWDGDDMLAWDWDTNDFTDCVVGLFAWRQQ